MFCDYSINEQIDYWLLWYAIYIFYKFKWLTYISRSIITNGEKYIWTSYEYTCILKYIGRLESLSAAYLKNPNSYCAF